MNENQPNKLLNPSKTRKLLAASALGVAGVAAAAGIINVSNSGDANPAVRPTDTEQETTTTLPNVTTTSIDEANNEIVFPNGVRVESNADGQGHLENPDYATTTTNPSNVSTAVPGETVDPNGVHLIPPATLDGNG